MFKLYVDFETYFDTKIGYGLKELSMTEYIRDPRFKTLGCGYYYKENGEWEYGWVRGEDMAAFNDLDWSNIIMVAHNVKFDGAIFAWKYGIRPARYFDTQSLSRAVLGQNLASHSLRSVSEYLGLPPKGDLHSDGLMALNADQEQDMMVYNRRDLECCAQIDEAIGPQFPDNQLDAMDWTIRSFINPVLELDVPLLENMVKQEQERKEKIFEKLGIEKSVFSSGPQFKKLLEERGIEVPTKESPRCPGKIIPAFSLNDPGFLALKDVCPDLYEGRVAAKSTINETRGGNLASIGRGGPFPFDVQFSGAIGTHRYSGGSGAGGNPQNFPNKGDMRKAVKPPSGQSLVVGDFSAIEARIVAWLSKEPILIAAFIANADIYSKFAETVYGHTVTKKDNPTERKVGKESILGLGYNMGAVKFQDNVKRKAGITIEEREAYRIVNLYRSTYPNIPLLWKNAAALLPQMVEGYAQFIPFAPFLKLEKNAIVLPSGLRIQYPNLRWQDQTQEWLYDVYRRKYDAEPVKLYGGKLIENICQALAGEICKIAIDRCTKAGLSICGQVHDELLAVVKMSDAPWATKVMKNAMTERIPWWRELYLDADVHDGPSWQEAKG